jgi:hypothetical protein
MVMYSIHYRVLDYLWWWPCIIVLTFHMYHICNTSIRIMHNIPWHAQQATVSHGLLFMPIWHAQHPLAYYACHVGMHSNRWPVVNTNFPCTTSLGLLCIPIWNAQQAMGYYGMLCRKPWKINVFSVSPYCGLGYRSRLVKYFFHIECHLFQMQIFFCWLHIQFFGKIFCFLTLSFPIITFLMCLQAF